MISGEMAALVFDLMTKKYCKIDISSLHALTFKIENILRRRLFYLVALVALTLILVWRFYPDSSNSSKFLVLW